ncbi:MAG: tetratricopeptide repeat protein [Bacteroidota bacterium]
MKVEKSIHTVFILFTGAQTLSAQEKTFEREYTYKASEMDSKLSCRAVVINQLRSTLLDEVGVYVESEKLLSTSDVDDKFSQNFVENIATVSAGITKLQVLSETWNGEVFWMKAAITIDKSSLEQSLKQLVSDRQRVKELQELRNQLKAANQEISRLSKAFNIGDGHRSELPAEYNKKIHEVDLPGDFYDGLRKFTLHNYDGAVLGFNKAVQLNPDNGYIYFWRALARVAVEDYAAAVEDIGKAIEMGFDGYEVYFLRANTKGQLHDFKGAALDYNQAIAIDPENPATYLMLGSTKYFLNDFAGAVENCDKSLQLAPKQGYRVFQTRGAAKEELGDHSGAIADYDKAISLNSQNAEVYYHRAVARGRSGNSQGGCSDLRMASQLGYSPANEAIKKLCK